MTRNRTEEIPIRRGKALVPGGELAYLVAGDGPPIATAHPYGTSKTGRGSIPGFSTITVWPRGFSDSSPARDREDYGIWRLAEDLDAVRTRPGFDRWTFWGTSMGGFVGLVYALEYPDALTSLILDSTAPSHHYKDDPTSLYPTARASPEFARLVSSPSWDTLRDYFMLRSTLEDNPDPGGAWELSRETTDHNPEVYGEIMRRLEEFDTLPRLGEIRVPTLILAGGKDLQCPPSQARKIAEGIVDSVLKVYPEAGHGVVRHNPDGVVELVQGFVFWALAEGEDRQ